MSGIIPQNELVIGDVVFREVSPPEERAQERRVEAATLGAWGNIKLNWYRFLHFFACLISGSNDSIFEDHITLIPTNNFAKRDELEEYVTQTPFQIEDISEGARALGIFANKDEAKMAPFDGGKCFGGVIHFFRSVGNHDVERETAEQFRKGMPIQAAFYQAVYNEFTGEETCEKMSDLLIFAIDHAHEISAERLRAYWIQEHEEATLPILDAIHDYLAEGNNPRDGGLLEAVKAGLLAKGKRLGNFYATIRQVEKHFVGKNLMTLDRDRFAFLFGGLAIDPICFDETPQTVIESLADLEPGRYFLGLTAYGLFGGVVGEHATGFVINTDGTFHFLEPNFALGQMQREHLQRTVERTFSTYTGLTTFGGNQGRAQVI